MALDNRIESVGPQEIEPQIRKRNGIAPRWSSAFAEIPAASRAMRWPAATNTDQAFLPVPNSRSLFARVPKSCEACPRYRSPARSNRRHARPDAIVKAVAEMRGLPTCRGGYYGTGQQDMTDAQQIEALLKEAELFQVAMDPTV